MNRQIDRHESLRQTEKRIHRKLERDSYAERERERERDRGDRVKSSFTYHKKKDKQTDRYSMRSQIDKNIKRNR
jgi:hypothetical protein